MTLPRTPSQTVGPFFTIGLCRRPQNELVRDGVLRSMHFKDGHRTDLAVYSRLPGDPAR